MPKMTAKKSDINSKNEDTQTTQETVELQPEEERTTVEVAEEVGSISSGEIEIHPEVEVKTEIPMKKVRVATNRDHRCHIGGNWYTFKAGVQQNVPVNVKEVLNKAGILAVL